MRVMPGHILVLTAKKDPNSLIKTDDDVFKGEVHLSSSDNVAAGETVLFGDECYKINVDIDGRQAYVMSDKNIKLIFSKA